MKILILSVTAGQGHNATARALAELWQKRGHTVTVTDTLRVSNRLIYHVVDKGYLFASSKCKYLYGKSYYRLEKRKKNAYKSSFLRTFYRLLSRKLRKHVEEEAPDAIVCTHVFAAALLDVIRERHGLAALTFGIVTDFTLHPYWEEALRLDRLVLAHELLIPQAEQKGFARERILTTGIPIKPVFAEAGDRKAAKSALGLDPSLPLVLLMNGSMGYGNPSRLFRVLNESDADIQIAAVSGNNKKSFRAIDTIAKKKKTLNLGFTDQVPLLMDAADLIITKPGGLTVSEALAKRLPMILCNPIPGQEVRNRTFLEERGAALSADVATLPSALMRFFGDETAAMQESTAHLRKPHAAEDLCTAVERLIQEHADSKT